MSRFREAIIRFNEKWMPEPFSGCWLWTGVIAWNGYGHFRYHGRPHNAHRIAYILFRGEVPTGLDVCHKCDIRSCVNPDHLFLGTRQDNMRDCKRKGRTAFGSRQGSAKLTAENVAAIHCSTDSSISIGLKFGVSDTAIRQIRNGKTWRHLQ